jgi:TPP-dependent pyruvate/acetoin dehydrogenase alpha subunit
LIEARVYRFSLHTSHVGTENYREPAEIVAARQRDPLVLLRRYLEEQRLLDDGHQRELQEQVERTIDQAFASAEAAAPPDPADACRHLFAETPLAGRLVS